MNRKKALAALMAVSMLFGSVPAVAADTAEKSAFANELESRFVDPDRVYSSDTRWWLGDASATDETLLEEIQNLYDSGFRGVELCMQEDNASDKSLYAYGSEMWAHKWKLMMNKLLDLGMGVYLTSGTNWASSNVPESYMSPDSQEAMQILATSSACTETAEKVIAAGETYDEALGLPAEVRANTTLVGAYAYELDAEGKIVYGSETDLMEFVTIDETDPTNCVLTWTAPAENADATYMIFPIWTQGSYELSAPATENCYTTNYFDKRGVEALKRFWEDNYLNDEELNAKILEGDVELFMDSLEITYGENEEGFTYWSEDARQEFINRKGYDILPYLVIVKGIAAGFDLAYDPYYQEKGVYEFSGDNKELAEKLINDWQDVLTQLYEENMLLPLKEWLNSVGITTRAQISYGRPIEITEPSAYVDYPEAENLNQYNQADILRLHTAGAKLQNKVLSTETGGTAQVYATSFQTLLHDIYSQYAVGFQRVVWHIWTASYGYGNWEWPGYMSGFGGGTAFYRWGNREPSYEDYDEFNAHIGRIQTLMQTGKSRTDIAFIHNSWTQGMNTSGQDTTDLANIGDMNNQYAHMGVHYRSTELQDNGYTYDYVAPDLLSAEGVTFNEETKTIDNAGYRALVIYQDWLDYSAAEKIYELASKGMPVVVIDGKATYTTFNDGKDEELAALMAQLIELDNVRVAKVADPIDYDDPVAGGYDDEVYEMLQELGVRPYAEFDGENHQLLTQTREDENGNRYLYALNYCPNDYHQYSYKEDVKTEDHGLNIKTNIKMEGTYIPYSIDPWTGEVKELGEYSYEDGQTIIPIDLDYDNIALFAFEATEETKTSVVSTNADAVYVENGKLVALATTSGTVEATLSNGESVTAEAAVPESYDITNWDVTVSSWDANEESGDLVRTETIGDLTTENRKTSTAITDIEVKLDTLTTWNNIPEVGEEVSGEGHYKAVFNWDASAADGAFIDFGELDQSMKVWINGTKVGGDVSTNPTKVKRSVEVEIDDGTGNKAVPEGNDQYTGGVSWTKPVADVSEYLVDGENTIEIEYNSTLTNVLLKRGVIQEKDFGGEGWTAVTWWGVDVHNRINGVAQAVIKPYVKVELN
ncbi:MAG: hypothetical protein HUJ72_09815 [Blautia sp.]|nr:hypothetical protein [Blautia sp.]